MDDEPVRNIAFTVAEWVEQLRTRIHELETGNAALRERLAAAEQREQAARELAQELVHLAEESDAEVTRMARPVVSRFDDLITQARAWLAAAASPAVAPPSEVE